jgi:hypothetical protein
MRLKLFTTEADRHRVRTRILLRFFRAMLFLTLIVGGILVGRYALAWW